MPNNNTSRALLNLSPYIRELLHYNRAIREYKQRFFAAITVNAALSPRNVQLNITPRKIHRDPVHRLIRR